jgi:hypothetical protein
MAVLALDTLCGILAVLPFSEGGFHFEAMVVDRIVTDAAKFAFLYQFEYT